VQLLLSPDLLNREFPNGLSVNKAAQNPENTPTAAVGRLFNPSKSQELGGEMESLMARTKKLGLSEEQDSG